MPIKAAAKKHMRQTKKRTAKNLAEKSKFKALIKKFRESDKRSTADFKEIQKALDRAVKHKTIPAGRSARLKSRLAKLLKEEDKKAKPAKKAKVKK